MYTENRNAGNKMVAQYFVINHIYIADRTLVILFYGQTSRAANCYFIFH